MKKKEVFKVVATHLLTQNSKSVEPDENGMCRYRDQINNKSCAVGVLISDPHYDLGLEGCAADNISVVEALQASLKTKLNSSDKLLLCRLQDIHDYSPVSDWRKNLNDLAKMNFDKDLEDLEVSL
tara:strand:- start:29577 stop:29951 length:375 start_codon:yes stop_codon:yes gene_type:complete